MILWNGCKIEEDGEEEDAILDVKEYGTGVVGADVVKQKENAEEEEEEILSKEPAIIKIWL